MAQVTFYYIGTCPVCVRFKEIMQKLDEDKALYWHDFQKDMGDLGISYEEAVQQPLARDKDGKLHRGVDAFLAAWQPLPAFKLVLPVLSNPLIKSVFSIYYQVYAEWRLKKHSCYRYHGCAPHVTKKH